MSQIKLSINWLRFRFSKVFSKFTIYRQARSRLNQVRGYTWESRVLAHRNDVRFQARHYGLTYHDVQAIEQIRRRTLVKHLAKKYIGDLQIYTAFKSAGWVGESITPSLSEIGTVRHFEFDEAHHGDPYIWFNTQRSIMNQNLLADLVSAHKREPIDVFFCYGSGFELMPETIKTINHLGIATINMSLDDMSGLAKQKIGDFGADVSSVAPYFDMNYTSTLAACDEYLLIGANPYYLPVGANPNIFQRIALKRDIPIAFFGYRHDIRAGLVSELRRRGFEVKAYGSGWESGYLSNQAMVELINRTEIVLGHGHHASWGISPNVRVTCLKGRDFEIPMCGALYLTTFDPELQFWFNIGNEIVCYRTVDDLCDTLRFLLNRSGKMETIRQAAWSRSHQQHTWKQRFMEAFTVLGVLKTE